MSKTTAIVVTGGEGRLANALRLYFPMATFLSHTSLDVSNANAVNRFFSSRSVDLILHLGAETAPDAPGRDYLQANIVGTANIVRAAMSCGARLVYTSTDFVYPGTTGGYRETDPVLPRNTYAWSKLGGECAVACYHSALVVRGSWYSGLAYRSACLDAFHSKLAVARAACAIATLATSGLTGVVNVGGPRRSMYELIVTEFDPRVKPINRADLAYPYPADVSLDCSKAKPYL